MEDAFIYLLRMMYQQSKVSGRRCTVRRFWRGLRLRFNHWYRLRLGYGFRVGHRFQPERGVRHGFRFGFRSNGRHSLRFRYELSGRRLSLPQAGFGMVLSIPSVYRPPLRRTNERSVIRTRLWDSLFFMKSP